MLSDCVRGRPPHLNSDHHHLWFSCSLEFPLFHLQVHICIGNWIWSSRMKEQRAKTCKKYRLLALIVIFSNKNMAFQWAVCQHMILRTTVQVIWDKCSPRLLGMLQLCSVLKVWPPLLVWTLPDLSGASLNPLLKLQEVRRGLQGSNPQWRLCITAKAKFVWGYGFCLVIYRHSLWSDL